MQGVKITKIDDFDYGIRTDIHWEYNGKLGLKPEPIYCEPPPQNNEDMSNLILSIFLPLLYSIDEEIRLPEDYSITQESIAFWAAKLGSLFDESVYPSMPKMRKIRVSPVTNDNLLKRSGDRCALLWGGGADSSLNLADLVMERDIYPILVHIQRHEAGWTKKGMFQRCLRGMAHSLDCDYKVVSTNALDVQRNIWNAAAPYLNHKNLWNWGCVLAPNMRRFTGQVSSGHPLFFSILGALPDDVTKVIMAAATDDPWEPYAYGMNFWNERRYRGIKMIGRCIASKVEEYGLLFEKYPEVARYMKPCWDDTVQWCGKCKKCREAALMLKACHQHIPFEVKEGINKTGGLFKVGRLLAALYHYRKQPGREYAIEKELSKAVYDAACVLANRSNEWHNEK